MALVAIFAAGLFYLWSVGSDSVRTAAPAAGGAPASSGGGEALAPEPVDGPVSPSPGNAEELRQMAEQYQKLLAANPRNAEAAGSLGRVLMQRGDAAGAIAAFQSATDAEPERWEYRFQLARAQCALARWDECIGTLRQAQSLEPDSAAVAHNLGVALHRRGASEAAMKEFLHARQLNPGEAASALGLAISYDRLGSQGEARSAYEEYLRLSPQSPLASQVRAKIAALGK
jgi:Flp pilus assembly protein TadD